MTIVSAPNATKPVERFVKALQTVMADTPIVPAERAGAKRAAKRESDQRKGQAESLVEKVKSKLTKQPTPVISRQVRRAMVRKQQKSLLAAAQRQTDRS